MDDNNPQYQNQESQQPAGGQTIVGGKPPKKTIPFLIGFIVVGVLVIGILLVVTFSGGGGNKTAPQNPGTSNPVSPNGPQPAEPLDVEQASNAITEDLGSLNDDVDLPKDQLSDDNLDL